MSCCWYRRYAQAQEQEQAQAQAQAQAQGQAQDQDQEQRMIFREIGNVHVDINNENISVAVLAILALLLGDLDGAAIDAQLARYRK